MIRTISDDRDSSSSPLDDDRIFCKSPVIPPSQIRTSSVRLRFYRHFSNERTARKPRPIKSILEADSMGVGIQAPLPAVFSPCFDCVVDCDEDDCPIPPATEQCTDQCVVIACSDSAHDESFCFDECTQLPCDMEPCDGGANCNGDFDEFLQCCTDYHFQSSLADPSAPQIPWPNPFNDIWNAHSSQHPVNPPQAFTPHIDFIHRRAQFGPGANVSGLAPTESFGIFPQAFANQSGIHTIRSPHGERSGSENISLTQTLSQYGNQVPLHSSAVQGGIPPGGPVAGLPCLWGNCHATFSSMSELVGHVNLMHLRPEQAISPSLSNQQTPRDNALSCLWGDCQASLSPAAVSGPSTGVQPVDALNVLSSHLMQDHLGLISPRGASIAIPRAQHPRSPLSPAMTKSRSKNMRPGDQDIPTPASSPSATPEPSAHDCDKDGHICHWRDCGRSFASCDDLTAHISLEHVGAGKSQYHCYWAGCNRHGEHGFASKQKILRHLQSHTGHRPFQCKICNQNFSEAATLQQHMRRHTQEKPFVCDFPGCGKAFAITGALTIHKRTHNGERPFKCPQCDRAFAESSNLSKHVRTHTGARPYSCPEPGCDKSFARPDQLQRHANVHAKKRNVQIDGTVDLMV